MEAVIAKPIVISNRNQNLVLTAALLGWFFDGFEMGLFPIIARPSLASLLGHANDSHIGPWIAQITALFLIGAALGGFLFGWLGDRIGRVRSLSLSVLTYSVFTGLCYFATEPWHLGALRFVGALGMGGEWALGVALVMETWPAEKRALVAGLIGAASNLGYFAVAACGSLMHVTVDSWRHFVILGALPGLLTFFIRLYVPESERWQACTPSRNPLHDIFALGYAKSVGMGVALCTVFLLGTWGAVSWAPTWVDQLTHGTRPEAKVFVQMAYAFGATIGSFAAAMFCAMWRPRAVYGVLCVLSLASCLTLYFCVPEFGALFLFVMLLIGLTSGSFYGWAAYYLPALFPTKIRATAQGIAFNMGRAFAAIGVLGTGSFVQFFGGNYAHAGAVTCLIYGVGFVFIWFAPEKQEELF